MPIRVIVTADFEHMSDAAATFTCDEIGRRMAGGDDFVLGLATGNSPVGLYRRLARAANTGAFDCRRIRTFNLDEYVGLPGHDAQQRVMHPESYAFFMTHQLFGQLEKRFFRSYMPGGHMIDQRILMQELEDNPGDWKTLGTGVGRSIAIRMDAGSDYLRWIRTDILQGYDDRIEKYGGIGLQVVGVGQNGHVAFHEAGIPFESSRMLLVRLDETTIANAVADGHFPSIPQSPHYAVSMGIELVFKARKVMVLANGKRKINPVARSLLGEVSPDLPLSYAQTYAANGGDLVYVVDRVAVSELLDHSNRIREKGIVVDDRSGG